MKNSPLKNKIKNWIKDESYDNKAPIIRITDDVKSAVDWLKKEIALDFSKIQTKENYKIVCLLEARANKFINKAFEDIK